MKISRKCNWLVVMLLLGISAIAQAAPVMQQTWKLGLDDGVVATAAVFSPHGNRLVLGLSNGKMVIYGTTGDMSSQWSDKPLFENDVASGSKITALAFDPQQKILAIGAESGLVNFSNNTGKILKTFKFPAAVKQIVFSNSGDRVLILCNSSTVRAVDLPGYELSTYNYKFFRPAVVAFGANSNEIVEGLSNAQGEIVKGNINQNRETVKMSAIQFGITALAVNTENNVIAAAGAETPGIGLWTLDGLQPAGGIVTLDYISELQFGTDGSSIFAICVDGTLKKFGIIDGDEQAAVYYGSSAIALALKPDAPFAAVSYGNGDVCMFRY